MIVFFRCSTRVPDHKYLPVRPCQTTILKACLPSCIIPIWITTTPPPQSPHTTNIATVLGAVMIVTADFTSSTNHPLIWLQRQIHHPRKARLLVHRPRIHPYLTRLVSTQIVQITISSKFLTLKCLTQLQQKIKTTQYRISLQDRTLEPPLRCLQVYR